MYLPLNLMKSVASQNFNFFLRTILSIFRFTFYNVSKVKEGLVARNYEMSKSKLPNYRFTSHLLLPRSAKYVGSFDSFDDRNTCKMRSITGCRRKQIFPSNPTRIEAVQLGWLSYLGATRSVFQRIFIRRTQCAVKDLTTFRSLLSRSRGPFGERVTVVNPSCSAQAAIWF